MDDTNRAEQGHDAHDAAPETPETSNQHSQNTAETALLLTDTQVKEGAEDNQKPAVVPETYDLVPPDGSTWNDSHMQAFQGHARDLGLNKDQAQRLLGIAHADQAAQLDAHRTQVEQWATEVRTDKELGGQHLAATVMQAKAGLQQFDADGSVFSMLEQTGYANHPAVIRFLSCIGKSLGEDTLITSKDAGPSAPLEDRLFKNMNV